jgi:phosphatidylserine decarboxylase
MDTIEYINRTSGEVLEENPPSSGMLRFLYTKPLGKLSLNLLFKRKLVSALGGWYMDSRLSKKRITNFIKEQELDISDFQIPESGFKTFNQFFYRNLKPQVRLLEDGFVSPADGKILVFENMDTCHTFFIKGVEFNVSTFLNSKELGRKYEGGSMAIVRLAPVDYHRYHFPVSGHAGPSIKVKGHYYSVSPLALRKSLQIFLENKREYTILKSQEFGDVVICDVGATMVGTIIQTYKPNTLVQKGDEKGYFAFGGSTLVLLMEKGKLLFNPDLVENTKAGKETTIKMGQQIGVKAQMFTPTE